MPKTSKMNDVIGEALGVYGAKGALREEIFSLIYADLFGDNAESKRKALSNALTRAIDAELIVRVNDHYYLKECDPTHANGHQNGSAPKVQIATYTNKRSGKTVSLYKSPMIISDAIALAFLIDEQWYKMPLFGSVRICIGQGDPPMWSADQEMYRNVVQIRITHKGGLVTEEHTSPADIITIAPED